MTAKNPCHWDDRYVYVQVPVIQAGRREERIYFTASRQDQSVIEEHRWRLVGRDVVTVDGTKRLSLVSLILHSPSGSQPHQRDGNPLNLSRDNLRLGANAKMNEVLINGAYAYLTLPDARLAVVDAKDAERVQHYYWKMKRVRGEPVIRTQYKTGEKWRKVDLARFVLNYSGRRPVVHLNGDYLDCRTENLRVADSVSTYE